MTRVKAPMGPITNDMQALHGFEQLQTALILADNAYSAYEHSGTGTQNSRKHLERYEIYAQLVNAWTATVRTYLRDQAAKELQRDAKAFIEEMKR